MRPLRIEFVEWLMRQGPLDQQVGACALRGLKAAAHRKVRVKFWPILYRLIRLSSALVPVSAQRCAAAHNSTTGTPSEQAR
jgi:hypothetical protein